MLPGCNSGLAAGASRVWQPSTDGQPSVPCCRCLLSCSQQQKHMQAAVLTLAKPLPCPALPCPARQENGSVHCSQVGVSLLRQGQQAAGAAGSSGMQSSLSRCHQSSWPALPPDRCPPPAAPLAPGAAAAAPDGQSLAGRCRRARQRVLPLAHWQDAAPGLERQAASCVPMLQASGHRRAAAGPPAQCRGHRAVPPFPGCPLLCPAGHCSGGPGAHPPHPPGPGSKLLRILLRDLELPRARLPPGQAGMRQRLLEPVGSSVGGSLLKDGSGCCNYMLAAHAACTLLPALCRIISPSCTRLAPDHPCCRAACMSSMTTS